MPFIPASGYGNVNLDPGIPVTVVNAFAAAVTGTGIQFTVQPRGDSGDRDVTFDAVPNGAVTTVTVDLEVSSDGGASFQKKKVGINLINASVSTADTETLQAGLIYRLNVTANAGGTSVSINAVAN